MQIKHTFLFTFVLGIAWTGYLFAFSLGPDPGVNGVFGSNQTCNMSGCHTGNPVNASGGSVSISGLPSAWTPSQTYPLTVTVSRTNQRLFGFQLSAVVDGTTQQAGNLTVAAGVKIVSTSGIQFAEHSSAKAGSGSATFTVNWTAPASASAGTVRFNVAGNAANGDFTNQGDFIYTNEYKIGPAAAPPPPPPAVTTFYFAQVADGVQDPTTLWKTTIFITNPSPVGSPPATGLITVMTSAGAPFNAGFVDAAGTPVSNGNTVQFTVSGGETRKFVSTAPGGLSSGFAIVTADADVRGTALFSKIVNGTVFAEAGVSSASAVARQAIFADMTAGFDTGVAYANPNGSSATITLQLFDSSGNALSDPKQQMLGANQQNAVFVSQLFPQAPPFTGTMRISSDVPVAAVALRFASTGAFTTLPPVTLQDQ
jgi:hypothetical protein